jgi:CHAT domain-containing protein/tetratricopeptide (TPR) repeat protein
VDSSTTERALAMVMADPRGAQALAADLLARARRETDPAGEATALRVLGLAAREQQDAVAAAQQLRRSVTVASRAGLDGLAAESRMSLALVLDDLGRPRAAIREIGLALTALRGLPLARARMQQGILLRRLGREADALNAYSGALTSFRRHGDVLWQARVLTNRGVLQAYRGGLAQARTDLVRAQELYRGLGLTAAVAQVEHNLGFVAAQGGDLVSALDWYDRADEHFRRSGSRPAVALIDRAELLLAARLLHEARQAAQDAVQTATDAQLGSLVPHAKLLLAQSALAAGDREAAHEAAGQARRAFQRQQRERWAVHARYLELRSAATPDRAALRKVAAALEHSGWAEQALEARVFLASMGDTAALAGLAPAPPRSGLARWRVRAWHGRALSLAHRGDTAGAKRALDAGLRLLDQYRAALGATELRVLSSGEGAELAALGIELALADRQPRQMLSWAERWRAVTLRLRPASSSHDPELTRDLAQLRRVGAELIGHDGDPLRRQRLLRRQRALEEAIRGRTWRAGAAAEASTMEQVSIEQIMSALGDRALVELVEQQGHLVALVAVAGRVHMRQLADAAAVTGEVAALRFALRRLVARHGSVASLAAAEAAARHGLRLLDDWLLAPIRPLTGDRELVVVPTGALQALPWSALPSCAGRPVTVAPSATVWSHAATMSPTAVHDRTSPAAPDDSSRARPDCDPAGWSSGAVRQGDRAENAGRGGKVRRDNGYGRTVLVAAEDPPCAIPEVQALAARLPHSGALVGAQATVQATLSAMDGAGRAHIAAHGAFRADNPLFSYLSMADGPMTVHHFTSLGKVPELVVLSACDTGLSTVYPGDELMGLSATLLGAGTRTLVASIGPVEDSATQVLMVELHRHLDAGKAPAEALALARNAAQPEDWATAHSFTCFGAGTV